MRQRESTAKDQEYFTGDGNIPYHDCGCYIHIYIFQTHPLEYFKLVNFIVCKL